MVFLSPRHQGPLGFPELSMRILEISDTKFTGSLSPNYLLNRKPSSFRMNVYGGLYMVYKAIEIQSLMWTKQRSGIKKNTTGKFSEVRNVFNA